MDEHKSTKVHKRRFLLLNSCDRLKQLKDEPYTQKEAEAAVGLMTDNGKL